MKSYKKLTAILLVNLFIFLALFALIETTFRLINFPFKATWTPPEHAFGRYDETLGWSYMPNESSTINFRDKSIDFSFDKDGIRIPYPGFEFDYKKPSVLFIGGSFTMGHGLTYDESFPGKFSKDKDVPYQIVNLGVEGFGSDQALLMLRKSMLKFNTKVVVYTFISSHVTRNGNYDRRLLWPGGRYKGTKPLFALNNKNELYLKKKPRLYKDYTHSYLLDFLKMRVGKLLGIFPPKPKEVTKAIIRDMDNYCKDHGVNFVAINWRWKKKKYNYEDMFYGIQSISTLNGAPENWQEMMIPNNNHPDERACAHISRLLVDYFRKNNLLKTSQ